MNELKVNFGCGGNILDGFKNHDIEQDGVDIAKPLPYADGTVDFILAEHVCEHIPGPAFYRFIVECRRVLKKGGILRICIPVVSAPPFGLHGIMGRQQVSDLIVNHGHQAAYNPALVVTYLWAAGFALEQINQTGRVTDVDGHWKTIGPDQDYLETFRVEAIQ